MTEASRQRHVRPFEAMHEAQLRIYAAELAVLHRLLRSRVNAWMETEQYLRIRGTHAETIHQVLSAAYMAAQLVREEKMPAQARATAADRLSAILQRGLAVMQDYREQMGHHAQDDLGLAALLGAALRSRAAELGWDVQVRADSVETLGPSAMSEIAAYLSICEALDYAAADPQTRRVMLTMRAESDRLRIELTICAVGAGPEQTPGADHPAALLTRLYARRAGGSCTWERIPAIAGGASAPSRMELVLPWRSAP